MKKKSIFINVGIIVVISIGYALIYQNAVLTSDDYFYILGAQDGLGYALSFFGQHYMEWSGRLAHLVDILFLMSEGFLWKIVTPILLATLPFLMFYFVQLRLPSKLRDYAGIAVIYLLMTTFSDLYTVQMLYWHTACITYLYFPYFMILFLIPFRKSFENSIKEKDTWPKAIIFSMIAFILGFSQEVVGAITFAFIFCSIGYKCLLKRKVYRYEIFSLVFALIGFVILLKSPGNQLRLEKFDWWNNAGLMNQIKHGLGYFIFNQYHVQWTIWSVMILLLVWSVYKQNKMIGMMCFPVLLGILFVGVLNISEGYFEWSFLENWKYTLNYISMYTKDLLIPLFVYGSMSLMVIVLSAYLSWTRKSPFLFVTICAVLCSNLTTLASPVGTSYISFPGIMLTFGLIMYLFPSFDNKFFVLGISALSLWTVSSFMNREIVRMQTIKNEETERLSILQDAVNSKLKAIQIPEYSERVWEGNSITDSFRTYYGIPNDLEIMIYPNEASE